MNPEERASVRSGLTISSFSAVFAVCGAVLVFAEGWPQILGTVCLAWGGFGLARGVWELILAIVRGD